MPRKRSMRALLATGVALAGAAGLAFTQVTPAMADPTVTLVAVGSDTVQDVYNQFALDLNSTLLGSYDAINPVTQAAQEIITPTDGTAGKNCSFQRPNGSGAGTAALQVATNPSTTYPGETALTGTQIPQPGCVDIARSSSGVAQQSNTGALVWIPFATDAVAGATGPSSCTTGCTAYNYTYTEASTIGTTNIQNTVSATPVVSVITKANLFTEVDLLNLYANCQPVTEGGVTYWPLGSPVTQPAGSTVIDLYIPQSGSGTAKFWAKTLGNFSLSTLPACVHQTIVGGPLATATGGVPIEEHNGTPMATDPAGFGPFSIAQWIAQSNGHNDRRHAAVVQPLVACSTPLTTSSTCSGSPVVPFTGTPGNLALNGSFPITRPVYSVVSFARVTNTSDPLYSFLNGNSIQDTLCNDASTITGYGFALNGSCGAILTANRGND
jgi:ABC-type phosphate transport system substrate-binding protein